MDRKLSQNEELARLIRLSGNARSQLTREIVQLQQRLDVPARLKSSLKSHTSGWILGSLLSGVGASLLFRRKRSASPKMRRSFPVAVTGLILTAVRPLLKVRFADQVKSYLSGQFRGPSFTPLP